MELVDASLEKRICEIKGKINDAAKKSGRKGEDVTLIAVTKYVDDEIIKKTLNLGLNNFGESRAQCFLNKYENVSNVNWHFIGRLQTNKVKYIVDKVCLVHSLDRIELANEINRLASKRNVIVDTLVQVNISGESTKAGIRPEYCEEFLEKLSKLINIKVRGLMTVSPFIKKKDEIRQNFAKLNKLFIDITRKKIHNVNMDYLSAGMTNDFETAIEEGSNMVRIGTGLFGER
jgi:hypothetical protein